VYTVQKFTFDKLLFKSLQHGEGIGMSEKTINYGDLSIQAVMSEKTINYGDLSIQAVLSEKTINYGDLSIQAVLSEKTSKLWLQVIIGHIT
jgi:hypothetical protein